MHVSFLLLMNRKIDEGTYKMTLKANLKSKIVEFFFKTTQ